MIGKLLGALAGRSIDRKDGSSGITGALVGAAAVGLVRRAVVPLGITIGGGFLAGKLLGKRRQDRKATGTTD